MVSMPVEKGFVVTSGFGPRWGTTHWGTDFGVDGGSGGKPIFAVKDGRVTRSGPASGFGRWITVDHPANNGGGETIYGHILPEVTAGQAVTEGQRIGRIDPDQSTNGGVAPHLHLEWHRYSWAPPGPDRLDPMTKLAGATWPGTQPTKEAAVGKPTEQYKADKNIWVGRHNGVRKEPRRGVCLHTDESAYDYAAKRMRDSGWSAERLAQYNNEPGNRGSYHMGVDEHGNVIRQVNDRGGTWSVGNQGNNEAIHICMAGTTAHWTREQWMTKTTLLLKTAQVVAHTALFHGIPIRRITADQTRAGSWGINGHWDWTKALGGSTHWDPGGYPDTGGGFPWDIFMELVQQEADKIMGTNKPEPAPEEPTDEPAPQPSPLPTNDELTLDQLVGPEKDDIGRYTFGGWDCLGGRTLVEAAAAIGEKVGVPGCYDPHAQDHEPDDGTPESEAEYVGRRRLND